MPRRTSRSRRGGRKMKGKGFMDFFRKVGSFFAKHKIISRAGNILGKIGVPYAGTVGTVAGLAGYGRRRRGGALRLSGSGRRRGRGCARLH